MPKIDDSKKLIASVTIKLTRADYDLARALADRRQLPLAEWARDRFQEMLGVRGTSPAAHAILAEVLAAQDELVGLLCALGRDGSLTSKKAQEIIDAAHARRYRDVDGLFEYAHSRIEARRQRELAKGRSTGAGMAAG